MAKYAIHSKRGAPPAGAYSQGWRAGDFVFVTGTGPIDPATGSLVGESIEQQTEQTIDNLATILEADGASQPYPVRTTVGSDLRHTPGMLIEIDCIAYSVKEKGRQAKQTLTIKVAGAGGRKKNRGKKQK